MCMGIRVAQVAEWGEFPISLARDDQKPKFFCLGSSRFFSVLEYPPV